MKKLRNFSFIISIIGVLDALYLTYIKISHTRIYCTPGLGDCATVNNTKWSLIMGIPLALFGALMYLAIIMTFYADMKNLIPTRISLYVLFGISLFGFVYSLFLTYLELFVIHAACQWCILSAICITTIFIVTTVRLKDYQFQPNN